MKTKMEVLAAVAIAVFLFSAATSANAQSDAVRQIYAFGATVPTNIAGIPGATPPGFPVRIGKVQQYHIPAPPPGCSITEGDLS